jgi:hypothetical protein
MSKGKIGIFCPGASGDIGLSMGVLKYKDILWPGKDIVWFCSLLPEKCLGYTTRTDMFKFNDAISEIRHWPEGYGLPERCRVDGPLAVAAGFPMWEDFSVLKTENNRLHQEKKYDFESTKDLDEGYFSPPWLMPNRPIGTHYADVPKIAFGADRSWEWHPYLCFSDEEREITKEFCSKLPYKKTIMLETFMCSGDVHWNDGMTRNTMRLCREKFGKCNFIFATNLDNSRFFDDGGVVSCSNFTIRQTALIHNNCDLFIGVCSGISIAVSCWGNKPVPRIEWCGSLPISMVPITNGPISTILVDGTPLPIAERQLESKILETLNKIC